MKDILSAKLFDSRIKSEDITRKERWLGYFVGPISVMLLNSILNNYLNVYYTDVVQLGHVWNGWFLTVFPIVVKVLDALTFLLMGVIVDRFFSRQGVARPWILLSAPLLVVSMILLFAFPDGSTTLLVVWIFLSYNLFYSIAYTAYNTAHTLMVPLSTKDPVQRSQLSVLTNSQGMISGMVVAVLFPTFIVPKLGIDRSSWIGLMTMIAGAAFPFILLEYYFTRERVTEESRRTAPAPSREKKERRSLFQQLRLCARSRTWVVFMIYLALNQLVSLLSSFSTFYYCNWVLGSYNDGVTQSLYYAVGNGPLGIGLFLCRPICKRLGRRNAMVGGFVLAAVGTLLCFLNPQNLALVLAGQVVKSIGLIPSTYMVTAMLGDSLDDVEAKTGERCDGFSSSVFNTLHTLATGLAMCILNLGLTQLGYTAPAADGIIAAQGVAIQQFFTFCAVGAQTIAFPIIALVLMCAPNDKQKGGKS